MKIDRARLDTRFLRRVLHSSPAPCVRETTAGGSVVVAGRRRPRRLRGPGPARPPRRENFSDINHVARPTPLPRAPSLPGPSPLGAQEFSPRTRFPPRPPTTGRTTIDPPPPALPALIVVAAASSPLKNRNTRERAARLESRVLEEGARQARIRTEDARGLRPVVRDTSHALPPSGSRAREIRAKKTARARVIVRVHASFRGKCVTGENHEYRLGQTGQV